jgi:hypothetical protein
MREMTDGYAKSHRAICLEWMALMNVYPIGIPVNYFFVLFCAGRKPPFAWDQSGKLLIIGDIHEFGSRDSANRESKRAEKAGSPRAIKPIPRRSCAKTGAGQAPHPSPLLTRIAGNFHGMGTALALGQLLRGSAIRVHQQWFSVLVETAARPTRLPCLLRRQQKSIQPENPQHQDGDEGNPEH